MKLIIWKSHKSTSFGILVKFGVPPSGGLGRTDAKPPEGGTPNCKLTNEGNLYKI